MLSSEGGHLGLASWDQEQFELEQFAKKKFGIGEGYISAEWLFCGLGIPVIYEYLLTKSGKTLEKPVIGEEVFTKIDSDPIAKRTFEIFLRLLGTCLAHLSAVLLPDEGVFVCGSIVSSVIEYIKKDVANPQASILISAFTANKCVGSYLKTVPIVFTPEVDLGLKGCWNFLQIHHKI